MNIFQRGVEALRQPDRNPRCYELPEAERLRIIEWQNRNVWNTPDSAKVDNDVYYGA